MFIHMFMNMLNLVNEQWLNFFRAFVHEQNVLCQWTQLNNFFIEIIVLIECWCNMINLVFVVYNAIIKFVIVDYETSIYIFTWINCVHEHILFSCGWRKYGCDNFVHEQSNEQWLNFCLYICSWTNVWTKVQKLFIEKF